MGLLLSRQLSTADLKAHQSATGLSYSQVEHLHARFQALDRKQRGYLTPTELLRIPQLAQNPLHRQIVDGFFAEGGDRIDFEQFLRRCAIFLVPQFDSVPPERVDNRVNKMRLLCQMLDTRRAGFIACEDFRQAMDAYLSSLPRTDAGDEGAARDIEAELQLLMDQMFEGRETISYEMFEQRLSSANVEGRLVVNKWLVGPNGEENGNGKGHA
ncbi:calcineurin B homologous protein 1 [Scaptodrosophila lebanonensis]|uniref:Calcineurin B homologous protein 1 n=1 Tax=Drosophila lebanonensis TaxID=7225 RepID=A0A6J2TWF5_DROLE|nr:calcineurin B homologous protein 1 [Scaptodrosophila lebanonensis]